MKRIVVSIRNSLLAEAITNALSASGEFSPYRVAVGDNNSLSIDCRTVSADILLAEVSYASETTLENRIKEIKSIRKATPNCKIALLCDENSAPDIASEITNVKREGFIDAFFYSSVTAKYLTAVLASL